MAAIDKALADLDLQEYPNYSGTAKKYDVNRTTLSRRHKGVTGPSILRADSVSLLTHQQQRTLVDYINILTERGILFTSYMVRNFAHDICGIWPAKNWPGRFSERWKDELTSDYLSGIDLSRKKADNEY